MQNNNNTSSELAFVFPGQGSQSVGMLAEFAQQFPLIEETYAEASKILNYDLWQLVKNGPEEILNQTEKTQPALLAGSVAVWRIWQAKHGSVPAMMAGHSLGEYSALVCADAINFSDAIKLVADRGRFMQEAVPQGQGAMAAIVGLDEKIVIDLCGKAAQGEIVAPANFNAIGQIVIAGQTEAVKRVAELARSAGAKLAKLLPVSVPSHCELMQPAAKRLAESLSKITIRAPKIPVIHNVDVCSYSTPEKIREALIKQLDHPIRWVETIQFFARNGIKFVVECGPGKVLAGLNKRITTELETISVNSPENLQQALTK